MSDQSPSSLPFDSNVSKCVMVVDPDLPLGLIANTTAVLALSLGAKYPLIGPDLADGSEIIHAGLTTTPVPVLKGGRDALRALIQAAKASEGVFVVDVTDAAQTTTNYADYEAKLKRSNAESLVYLGLALMGPKKAINRLTGNMPLLR
jgi:hypothetical protein